MKYPQEIIDQAHRLYIPGVRGPAKISRLLGVPQTTVLRWLNPHAAERMRVESRNAKRRRKGTCTVCGGPTSYGGQKGKPVSTVCGTCARKTQHEQRRWTPEAVIAAIQLFYVRNGRPPFAEEWRRSYSPDYPTTNAVASYGGWKNAAFPTWCDAIEAAGYECHRGGGRPLDAPRRPDGRYA